jgi:hypothetical protein
MTLGNELTELHQVGLRPIAASTTTTALATSPPALLTLLTLLALTTLLPAVIAHCLCPC